MEIYRPIGMNHLWGNMMCTAYTECDEVYEYEIFDTVLLN